MVIEYFGLPGAGKTYLAKRYAEERNLPYVEINSRKERFGRTFLFLLKHPIIFFTFLFETIRETYTNLPLLKYKVLYLLFITFARVEKAEKFEKAVIDDGLFLYMLSMYESEVDEKTLSKFGSLFEKDRHHIFIVETEVGVRKERLNKRNRFPRTGFGTLYRDNWFNIIDVNFVRIQKFLAENYNTRLIQN